MIMFLDQDAVSGYTNFNTMSESADLMRKKAREWFASNPDEVIYSVALVDFETREHSILEFEIETKIDVSEY